MSAFRPHGRLAAMALVALVASLGVAASGCSLFRRASAPARPAAVTPPAAQARAASGPPSPTPTPPTAVAASAPAPAPVWQPAAVRHLDAATLVGQTWTFPSPDPQVNGDNRFVFRRDRVEASNAHEHVSGKWSVERDKLCVVLNASAEGTACYYVAASSAGALQILVLPGRERLPLQIR